MPFLFSKCRSRPRVWLDQKQSVAGDRWRYPDKGQGRESVSQNDEKRALQHTGLLQPDENIRNYVLPARDWEIQGGATLGVRGGLAFSRENLPCKQSDRAKAATLQGVPVADINASIAPMGIPLIRPWAAELFRKVGGTAFNPELGEVKLDERAIRTSLAHGRPNMYKVAAFAAVKQVLDRGVIVLCAAHGKRDIYYVSAPVRISGTDHIVTVLVHRDPVTQRMYLHSVAKKENLLNRRVSRAGAEAPGRSGSYESGDASSLANPSIEGKASSEDVAQELGRLLFLEVSFGADQVLGK